MVNLRPTEYLYEVIGIKKYTDGDTYDLRLNAQADIGFDWKIQVQPTVGVRLDGWDTPETTKGSSYERSRGRDAREMAAFWFEKIATDVWVKTAKSDDFGRWLGHVFDLPTGNPLGAYLAGIGLAVPWNEKVRWRDVYDKEA